MYRSDEKGHENARLDDEAKALEAEVDAWEHQDRKQDASWRKFRVVEIIVGLGLLAAAWAWQGW